MSRRKTSFSAHLPDFWLWPLEEVVIVVPFRAESSDLTYRWHFCQWRVSVGSATHCSQRHLQRWRALARSLAPVAINMGEYLECSLTPQSSKSRLAPRILPDLQNQIQVTLTFGVASGPVIEKVVGHCRDIHVTSRTSCPTGHHCSQKNSHLSKTVENFLSQ